MGKKITIEEAINLLAAHHQPNILSEYNRLTPGKRVMLLHQIADVNWEMVDMIKKGNKPRSIGKITPAKVLELKDIEAGKKEFHKRGQFLLRAGKVAAVMLAGGMGTRLGINKPKGEMNIGRVRDKYIYQCLIENLQNVVNMEHGVVPLYIMTNEDNLQPTKDFFEIHKYFGYPKDLISFFSQENNVCVDLEGNLFFDSLGHLASSPNGNGGWFKSMDNANLLPDLEKRGIEWINVFSVDNVLQRIADPVFIGAVALGGHDAGAKAVKKIGPEEKVGIFCNNDGHPAVVEYYELDEKQQNELDETGQLKYRFGVTLNYLFSVKKLRQCLDNKFPVHAAKKKIPYMHYSGRKMTPTEPNGYKFETLAADMVEMMDDCICFEIIRSKEFAPIKNAKGEDSVETARKLLEENGVLL